MFNLVNLGLPDIIDKPDFYKEADLSNQKVKMTSFIGGVVLPVATAR